MPQNKRFLASLLVGATIALSGTGLFVTAQGEAAPAATTLAPASVGDTTAIIRGSVMPNGQPTGMWFEYGTTEAFGSVTGAVTSGAEFQPVSYSFTLAGLKQNQTYYYRAVAQNGRGTSLGQTMRFMTGFPVPVPTDSPAPAPGQRPTVVTNAATGLTNATVTLQGTVHPRGEATSAWFEYGLDRERLSGRIGVVAVGANAGETVYTHQITQLLPNMTYYYRAAAENKFGVSTGTVMSFRTLTVMPSPSPMRGAPEVTTRGATNVTPSSAVLRGTVRPGGDATMAWFEYGTTMALGNHTPPQFLGNGTATSDYSFLLTNLQPGTTYIFRAVAENSIGRTHGAFFTVTTSGAPTPLPTPVMTPTPRPGAVQSPRPMTPGGGTPPSVSTAATPAMPTNLSPDATTFDAGATSVTLIWNAVPGNVPYAVRVEDHTDGAARDARNNCPNNPHYLCLNNVRATSVSVPVTPGHRYTWWVHAVSADGRLWSRPASAMFSVAAMQTATPTPTPEPTPTIIVGATDTDNAAGTRTDNLKFFSWLALAAVGGFLAAWIIFGSRRPGQETM